ncbi:FAD-binding oxidoreductase [Roseomonas sp. GC11]|uniref:NAD(P)/FAD-dependent oxidoreductase n=1 Tax=Roseomonas sp. GC11 TaxID=2950546 RepID=UPI00210954E3|nr:FAD-binding oxidoreductase [Roseomonas sp. GC11]MCQ4159659.1 FAD-binding oxidoreductase [Roseomonas sp. GC11]
MKLLPYWQDTATPFAGGASGPLEGKVDVAIIGGGFTGLSAALALAKRGASVVVLEAARVAAAASGRNGGHLNNGLAHDFPSVAASLGMERARALYHAFNDAVDSVERIVTEEGIACDFRRCGKIKLAAKPEHFGKLAASFEVLHREADPETALIPRERIREEVGSDLYHGGVVYNRSAQMHMGRFGAGLADAVARHGGRIFEETPVTGLTRLQGRRHRVATPRGSIEAEQVLVATGPSQNGPFGFFRRRIVAVGSFIIATEPLPKATLDAIMPTRRNATTSRIIGHYFRISPDDRLIFGGRARFAMSNPTSDRKSGEILDANMRTAFPQLRDTRVEYCWGGLVDMTADRLPRAGEHEGLLYAMGYSGHGAQMSVHMGQCMAAVMGGQDAANPLHGLDWPWVPGHFGPAWFLPLVGAYFSLKDKMQ